METKPIAFAIVAVGMMACMLFANYIEIGWQTTIPLLSLSLFATFEVFFS